MKILTCAKNYRYNSRDLLLPPPHKPSLIHLISPGESSPIILGLDYLKYFMTGKILSSAAIDLKGSSFASIFIFLRHKLSRHSLSSHQVHL